MTRFGGILLFFGIGTFVMDAMDREFLIMSIFGESQNIVAGAMTVIGAGLLIAGFMKKDEE